MLWQSILVVLICCLFVEIISYIYYFAFAASAGVKAGKVTSAGWQVTLCDLISHVISRSGVVISITNCYIRFTLLYHAYGEFQIPNSADREPVETSDVIC